MREWINKLWYIHTMEYYSAIKGTNHWHREKLEGIPNASCWMKKTVSKGHIVWLHLYDSLEKERTWWWKLDQWLSQVRAWGKSMTSEQQHEELSGWQTCSTPQVQWWLHECIHTWNSSSPEWILLHVNFKNERVNNF